MLQQRIYNVEAICDDILGNNIEYFRYYMHQQNWAYSLQNTFNAHNYVL